MAQLQGPQAVQNQQYSGTAVPSSHQQDEAKPKVVGYTSPYHLLPSAPCQSGPYLQSITGLQACGSA